MTLGRTSSSMEETFYLQALPDPSVPKPAEEDLPKVKLQLLEGSMHLFLVQKK